MSKRSKRLFRDPRFLAYFAVLILAEVLNFVLLSAETANDLWFAIVLIWFTAPFAVLIAVRALQGKIQWTFRAGLFMVAFFGFVGALTAVFIVNALGHKTTTRVLAFDERSEQAYGRSGTYELLTGTDGTVYEVNDPTFDNWDADHFWSTARFNVAYKCKVDSNPVQRYPEIYDCGRTSAPLPKPRPVAAAGVTVPGPAGTPGGSAPLHYRYYPVRLSTLEGQTAHVSLYVPSGSTLQSQAGAGFEAITVETLYTALLGATNQTAAQFLTGTGVSSPRTLADGVLTGTANNGSSTYWAKSVQGGAIYVLSVLGQQAGGPSWATVVGRSSATISAG